MTMQKLLTYAIKAVEYTALGGAAIIGCIGLFYMQGMNKISDKLRAIYAKRYGYYGTQGL